MMQKFPSRETNTEAPICVGQRIGGIIIQYAAMDDEQKSAFNTMLMHIYGPNIRQLFNNDHYVHDCSTDDIASTAARDPDAGYVLFCMNHNVIDKTASHKNAWESVRAFAQENGKAFASFSIGKDPELGIFASIHTHLPTMDKPFVDSLSIQRGKITTHGDPSGVRNFLHLDLIKPEQEVGDATSEGAKVIQLADWKPGGAAL